MEPIEIKGRYTKAEMFAKTVEESVYGQVYDIINNPAFSGKRVALMPDVHAGASGPCGLVAEIGDWICPEHIGVDIGCTVSMMLLNSKIQENHLSKIERHIKNTIPMGFNMHDKSIVDVRDFCKFLGSEFLKAKTFWKEVFKDSLPNIVTEKWIEKQIQRIGIDPGIFWKSLGTVGGGNHFIEYGENDYRGAFTFHFGSRNFGLRVCKHWMKKTVAPMSKAETKRCTEELKREWKSTHSSMDGFEEHLKSMLQEKRNSFIKGYLTGDDMIGYLCDMVFAQAYAKYNHMLVEKQIKMTLKKYASYVWDIETVRCTHNYIDFRDHYIRKSSISAHGGEKVVIPLNMRDGTVFGVGKGNEAWMNSCSHGAGRKMSRSEAKKKITLEEFESSMEGIVTTSVNTSTIDESPMAYKDSDEIIDIIKDSIEIVSIFKPKISWKASEQIFDRNK